MANFFRSLDRALIRALTPPVTGRLLLPTDPGAYEWPAVDLARHIEAIDRVAASLWDKSDFLGGDLIPLAQREIPAWGTE